MVGYEIKHDGGTIGLHVSVLPGNVRPSLYLARTNEFTADITTLATFHNDKCAGDFLELMEYLVEKKPIPMPQEPPR